MGSALDIWTAYREGVFGAQRAPWLGYFMVLEDCEKSSVPVRARSPHFDVREEFANASYKRRYELFCNKLVLERQYSAACFMVTDYNYGAPTCCCTAENLSLKEFLFSMLGAVAVHREEWRI